MSGQRQRDKLAAELMNVSVRSLQRARRIQRAEEEEWLPAGTGARLVSGDLKLGAAERSLRAVEKAFLDLMLVEEGVRLVPVEEAAKRLGVSRATAYRMAKDGRLDTQEIGGRIFVSRP